MFLRPFGLYCVTYIYYAIISRIKCVACAKLLMSIVFLLFRLYVEVGDFPRPLVPLYVSAFCLWVGCVSFFCNYEIGNFIFCRDNLSNAACVSFVKLCYLHSRFYLLTSEHQ